MSNKYQKSLEELKELISVYSKILEPGANKKEIENFTKAVKLNVPSDFLEFYENCNGSLDDYAYEVNSLVLMPLGGIVGAKKMFDQILDEKLKSNSYFCWSKDWIPFADNNSYQLLAVDTTGIESGYAGGIVSIPTDSTEDLLRVLAPNFNAYLNEWINRVKQGHIYSINKKDESGNNEYIYEGGFGIEDFDQVIFSQPQEVNYDKRLSLTDLDQLTVDISPELQKNIFHDLISKSTYAKQLIDGGCELFQINYSGLLAENDKYTSQPDCSPVIMAINCETDQYIDLFNGYCQGYDSICVNKYADEQYASKSNDNFELLEIEQEINTLEFKVFIFASHSDNVAKQIDCKTKNNIFLTPSKLKLLPTEAKLNAFVDFRIYLLSESNNLYCLYCYNSSNRS